MPAMLPATPEIAAVDACAAAERGATRATRPGLSLSTGLEIAALALYGVTRLFFFLWQYSPRASDLTGYYWSWVMWCFDGGRMPYSGFEVTYPPVGWWTMCLPRAVFGPNAYFNYPLYFRLQMCACDLAALLLLLAIGRRRCPAAVGWLGLIYVITTTIFGDMLFDRLDVGLLLLILAWAYCWLRGMEQPQARFWTLASYAALGLGFSYKFIPLIVMPFPLVAECRSAHRWRQTAQSVLVLAAAAGLPFLVHLPWAGVAVLRFMDGHIARGVQAESTYGSILMLARFLGLPMQATCDRTLDLHTAWSPALIPVAHVLPLVYLGLCVLWMLRHSAGSSRATAYRLAMLMLATAPLLAKVLSPQYFLWAIPAAALAAIERPRFGWRDALALLAMLTLVAGLTTYVFPYHYLNNVMIMPGGERVTLFTPLALINLPASTCLVAIARNLVYWLLVIQLNMDFFRHPLSEPSAAPPDPAMPPGEQI